MSENYERLMELLDRALSMPDIIDVTCKRCPDPPLLPHGNRAKHIARYDPDGDTSSTGIYAYRCDGCGSRFTLDGKMSSVV